MFAILALRRFLLLLALLGVAFGPVSAAAAAPAMTGMFGTHQSVMPGMDKDDCCRNEMPAQTRGCGGFCPLAPTCVSVAMAIESHANWLFRPTPRAVLHGPLRDDQRPSALVKPPTQPPKA